MVWIGTNIIVMGSGSNLYFYDLRDGDSSEWKLLANLSEFNLDGISRLAYHNGKIAVVVNGK
jgi:hypothetical protein